MIVSGILFYGEKLLVSGIALRHGEAQVLLGVLAQLLESFLAQIMLHLAGVGGGGFLAHAESYEKRSQRLMAAIDALGHLLPAFGKRDVAVLRHFDITAFPQAFHGNADTGLAVAQLAHNVNAAHLPKALL